MCTLVLSLGNELEPLLSKMLSRVSSQVMACTMQAMAHLLQSNEAI